MMRLFAAGVPLKHVDTVDKSQPVIEREHTAMAELKQQRSAVFSLSTYIHCAACRAVGLHCAACCFLPSATWAYNGMPQVNCSLHMCFTHWAILWPAACSCSAPTPAPLADPPCIQRVQSPHSHPQSLPAFSCLLLLHVCAHIHNPALVVLQSMFLQLFLQLFLHLPQLTCTCSQTTTRSCCRRCAQQQHTRRWCARCMQ